MIHSFIDVLPVSLSAHDPLTGLIEGYVIWSNLHRKIGKPSLIWSVLSYEWFAPRYNVGVELRAHFVSIASLN
jgi:hypothetical protein